MLPWRRTLRRLDGAYSDHTLRSYRSDFRAFLKWCRKKRLKVLPAASTTIAAYIDAEGTPHDATAHERDGSHSEPASRISP